jgi:hypothetical protein
VQEEGQYCQICGLGHDRIIVAHRSVIQRTYESPAFTRYDVRPHIAAEDQELKNQTKFAKYHAQTQKSVCV